MALPASRFTYDGRVAVAVRRWMCGRWVVGVTILLWMYRVIMTRAVELVARHDLQAKQDRCVHRPAPRRGWGLRAPCSRSARAAERAGALFADGTKRLATP